jgi:hypothetical protein
LDLTAGGDETDEARVQAALSSYIRSRRRGKRHTGPTDDDASGGVSSGLSGGGGSGSGASGGGGGPPQLKSPKRSKSGTPEDGNTPGRRSPIDGSGGSGAGGGDSGGSGSAAHMQRFAQDVLASFAAMGSGGAPGGAAGGASGHTGGSGGSLPPPLRYDLGGLFSDGPDGPFALGGDDVAADFLLDDLVGDPGGYNVLR